MQFTGAQNRPMERIDHLSGVSGPRAEHAPKSIERAPRARIEHGGIVVLVLPNREHCGE